MVPVFALVALLAAGGTPPSYDQVHPVLVQYCYECHGRGSARGDVVLDGHRSAEARREDGALWNRVWEHVRNDLMPPPGHPRPDPAERARLGAWIRGEVQGVDCREPDPGRVTIRRLNRDEYNHTVADLFGIDVRPADDFPPDDTGYGFDNLGEVLSVSPVLTEKYFNAAEQVVKKVVATRPEIPRRLIRREDLRPVPGPGADKVTVSEARFTIDHPGAHAVEVKVSVSSFRPFFGEARLQVELDGRRLVRASYPAGNRPYRYRRRTALTRGEHRVRVTLDLTRATENANRAINIALDELVIEGPVGTKVREYPPAHRRLFFRGPAPRDPAARDAYARAILEDVAGRAFRRPVEPATLDRLVLLARETEQQSGRFETGIAQALQAILTSPRFLFRAEPQPGPEDRKLVFALDEHALASRLSYFLHGSAPDERLGRLAARGELRANLRDELRRLVRDPRSDRFVSRFVGQWLQTRDVETVNISTERFRELSGSLRRLMRVETEMLFAHILREERDALEILTASYTFLNAALAEHYGLPGVEGPAMRRVSLPAEGARGGILSHGSFLTVTSNPTRTSPVKRGLYVLDNLLGTPPPPPPPEVPSLDQAPRKGDAGPRTVRARLEAHREDRACAGCHARMDPIGLALEGFDAIGRARADEQGQPLDTSGKLVTGERISGVNQLRTALASRREAFYRTLTRKLMVFALGRGLVPADECTVDRTVAALLAQGGKLTTLLAGVVESPAFQMRRGEP